MKRLEGKVAWISGATSGIGEATARLFAQEGAKVCLVGRRLALSRCIAAELKGDGNEALPLACDVSEEQEVRHSFREAVKHFGRLDIVVNNAGMVHIKQLHQYTEREWNQVMDVNVTSMFFAAKHALPYLRKAGGGYIVNVGSISSFVGQALTPVYTTTKHAVVGLTKSIALDYAVDGIRCNCVCPGITDTPMLREHLNAQADPERALTARLRRVPMGVALTPHDVAKTILFLSCEDSSGITGASIIIDAGYLSAAEWETRGKTAFMVKTKSRRNNR
jgi:NAD(P)-dependent dehydrogenase (short-subunit alcohol dehydrogenase family)